MQSRPPAVPGRWVVLALLILIVLVVGIATLVFLLKNPLHSGA
jgi:hypothetical protein